MLTSNTAIHAQEVLTQLPTLYIGGYLLTIFLRESEQFVQKHFSQLLKDEYKPLVEEIMIGEFYDREHAVSGYFPHFIAMIVAIVVGVSFELIALSLTTIGLLILKYTTGTIIDPSTTLGTVVVFSSFVAVALYQKVEFRVRTNRTYLGY